jgi:hypothetical protein
MAVKINNALRSNIADRITAYLSGTGGTTGTAGMLRVYGGVRANAAGDLATGPILVQINSLAWSSGSNGTSVLTGTKTGTSGTSGTATWARMSGTDGTSYVIDGDCGTSSTADFVIDASYIITTAVVSLTAATIVQPGQ